jgi:hypothetical protein
MMTLGAVVWSTYCAPPSPGDHDRKPDAPMMRI